MNFINHKIIKTLYFEDEEGHSYRATSKDNVERSWGESWESEYNIELDKETLKILETLK